MAPSKILPFVFAILLGPSGVSAQDAAGQVGTAQPANAWNAGPHALASLRAAPLALIPYPRAVDWRAGKPMVLPPVVSVAGSVGVEHAALARVMQRIDNTWSYTKNLLAFFRAG